MMAEEPQPKKWKGGEEQERSADDAMATRHKVWQAMAPFREGTRRPTPADIKRTTDKFFEANSSASVEKCKDALKELMTQTGCNKVADDALLNSAVAAMAPKDGTVNVPDFLLCWNNWMKLGERPRTALIVVDVQHDFIDGSLALRACDAKQDGAEVVPIINALHRTAPFDLVVITKDWHPRDHISFHPNLTQERLHSSETRNVKDIPLFAQVKLADGQTQTMWPAHCVQGSKGAELHKDLEVGNLDHTVVKGTNSMIDSYSAFFDNARKSKTPLSDLLRRYKIDDVYCCGLAYDVCVGFTALDGVSEGFNVHMVRDASRAVSEDGAADMTKKLQEAGVVFHSAADVPAHLFGIKQAPGETTGTAGSDKAQHQATSSSSSSSSAVAATHGAQDTAVAAADDVTAATERQT